MVNCLIICALMKKTITMTKPNGLIKSFKGKILYNKNFETIHIKGLQKHFPKLFHWLSQMKILIKTHNRRLFKFFFNFLDTLKGLEGTNEMATNNTMMGWNNNSGEDNLSAKTIINCTMPTGTWLPPQCMKRLVLKIKLGTSIPTPRWRIKLVNMVHSFS